MRSWTLLLVLGACSSNDWPSPPDDAVATCKYRRSPSSGISEGTIYYNAQSRVMRVDGFDGGSRIATDFEYDAQGRLVAERSPVDDIEYTYAADKITRTGTKSGVWTIDVVGDLAVVFQGPLSLPDTERTSFNFTYDAAGRLTWVVAQVREDDKVSRFEKRYAYDGQGRVTSISNDSKVSMITYTDAADQLVIDLQGGVPSAQKWTIGYDGQRRIVSAKGPSDVTYAYGPEGITERIGNTTTVATGACAQPSVELEPPRLLPLRGSANFVHHLYLEAFPFDQIGI